MGLFPQTQDEMLTPASGSTGRRDDYLTIIPLALVGYEMVDSAAVSKLSLNTPASPTDEDQFLSFHPCSV